MAKLILHIGAHKTGTTSLQRSFSNSRTNLGEFNVLYPELSWFHFAQHRLAFALRGLRDPVKGDVPDIAEELDALNSCIASATDDARILISSEEFFAATDSEVQTLKEGIICDDIQIFAVVRRPDNLLLSIYNQSMKTPQNDFKRPLKGFLQDPSQLNRDMEQVECVKTWSNVFGHEQVLLRRYEDIDLLRECLDILGASDCTIDDDRRVNNSVSAAVLEVMRISKIAKMDPKTRQDLVVFAQDVFRERPKLGLSSSERRQILEHYEHGFEVLFAEFGLRNSYRSEIVHETEQSEPEVPAAILYAQLVERLLKERKT